ncbi:hypothetical protein D3C86_1470210 [compost metagenome]
MAARDHLPILAYDRFDQMAERSSRRQAREPVIRNVRQDITRIEGAKIGRGHGFDQPNFRTGRGPEDRLTPEAVRIRRTVFRPTASPRLDEAVGRGDVQPREYLVPYADFRPTTGTCEGCRNLLVSLLCCGELRRNRLLEVHAIGEEGSEITPLGQAQFGERQIVDEVRNELRSIVRLYVAIRSCD